MPKNLSWKIQSKKENYCRRLFGGFVLLCFISSCSPKITTNIISERAKTADQVAILSMDVEAPSNATLIGTLKIGDTGFTTKCSQKEVIEDAIKECQKVGGNILKITKEKYPGYSSTCYGLSADIYHSLIMPVNVPSKKKENLAKLYFYRPVNYFGSIAGFKIFDSEGNEILNVRNGEKLLYETDVSGTLQFYGGKFDRNLLEIQIEKGGDYLIICRIIQGVLRNKYEMTVVKSK